jgi:hypothetical protein
MKHLLLSSWAGNLFTGSRKAPGEVLKDRVVEDMKFETKNSVDLKIMV